MFSTGTDEHGLKVKQAAEAQQRTPLAFSDEVSSSFKVSLCYVCRVLVLYTDLFLFSTKKNAAREMVWLRGLVV